MFKYEITTFDWKNIPSIFALKKITGYIRILCDNL